MSVYSYPQSKVIDEITFKKTEKGTVRAYLHAREGVGAAVFTDIIDHLQRQGLQWVPYTLGGRPTLEVRGFGSEAKLIKLLDQKQWIDGEARIQQTPDEHIGVIDKLKNRSLQLSGAVYSWGDISYIMSGWKGESPLNVAAGIFYGLPTPVLLAYGKNDQSDLQIKDAARQMANYLKKEGMNFPDSCSLNAIAADHKKGLLKTTDDLFRRYPSEFMNLCYATAGACIFAAGMKGLKTKMSAEVVDGWLKHLQKTTPGITREMAMATASRSVKIENQLNLAVGTTTVASGLFGTLVKEKTADPDQPKKTGMAGVWEWVRERPLAITGVGLMVSTLLHAAAASVAMKGPESKRKTSGLWRWSFVASALLAELLIAISSKGHGEGVVSDDSVDKSVIALAADFIAKQPSHRQAYLVDYVGNFLGRTDVLAMKDDEVKDRLQKQIESLRNNPWAKCAMIPEKTPAPAAPPEPRSAKSTPPNWQAKLAADALKPAPQHVGMDIA